MTPATIERLFWGAVALVAISVGLAAGPLPWRFAGESGLPAPPAPPPGRAAADGASLDPILALSPFGRAAPEEAPAPPVETELGLTLMGVVIADAPDASSAIVASASGPARSYRLGEEIVDGAMLAEVHPGRVVLEVSGRRETLSFPETGGVSTAEGDGLDALAALVAEGDLEDDLEEVAAASEPDQVIAWYRERLQEDPAQMLEDLGLEATDIGYAVGMTPAEEVARAGLRHGDVIVKVNGQQVGNIEADRELFDKVAASGHARIEVLRNGQPMVLSFPLR